MDIVNIIKARLQRIPPMVWLLMAGTAVACGAYISFATETTDSRQADLRLAAENDDAEAIARQAAVRNERAKAGLRAVDAALTQFPPGQGLTDGRSAALTTLDTILHEVDAAQLPAVQQFFHRRIDAAAEEMRRAPVRRGATIWQIYNHGFVVRTQSATLCFDLVRAKHLRGFALSEQSMLKIVQTCDVLFVSHVHADHAESFVAQAFIDQGKPVVAPEQIGYRDALYSKITQFEPSITEVRTLPVRQGRVNLRVVVFPGHQGDEIDNNVVLVTTPEGISVAHTGDQWDRWADFAWIDQVAQRFRVDILLPNDWTYDLARMVRGFRPALVIPGHANEIGHETAKRQPYALSYQRKAGSDRFGGSALSGYAEPMLVLAWGESYHYEPIDTAHR